MTEVTLTYAALWETAQVKFRERKWGEARSAYLAILALSPDAVPALLQLSYVESYLGNYRAARRYAIQAYACKPKAPELISALVSRLRTFNENEALNSVIRQLPSLSDIKIPHLLEFAAQLSYLNQPSKSLKYLEEAMRADPEYPPTLMAFGQIMTYLGRFDEAERYFQDCIAKAPRSAQAHWFLAGLKKQTPQSNHVRKLASLLSQKLPGEEDGALLYFAMHKELDDLKDYPAAWEALRRACTAKRKLLEYSVDESTELVDKLIQWSKGVVSSKQDQPASEGYTPIFIVGMHRSGTTLLEQILDGNSEVRGVGELYDFTGQMRYATDWHCRGPIDRTIVNRAEMVDFAEVGKRYIEKMKWRLGGERFFTDKLPSNFFNVGFICASIPHAKILHMVRDPMETCFSNLRELFSDVNAYSYDQSELAAFYLQYMRLMKNWHETFPGRILDVHYGELTRDPEAVVRRVADFCGLNYEPEMLNVTARKRAVATASAVQARQAIAARDMPKWAPYAQYLQPLMEALRAGGINI